MTDTESKEVEILPCPFCGESVTIDENPHTGLKEISCDSCDSTTYFSSRSKEYSIKAWNKRSQDNTIERSELYENGYEKGKEWVCNNPEMYGLAKRQEDNNDQNAQPPKERKVSLEEIDKIIEAHLEIAKAILSLLNATEERKGAE